MNSQRNDVTSPMHVLANAFSTFSPRWPELLKGVPRE